MKRRNIVEINNEHIVLNSQREFSDFKKRYNKYDFMQKEQNNVWEVKLKELKPDPVPEPTIRDVVMMLLDLKNEVTEMKKNFETRFENIEGILRRNNLH